MVTEEILRSLLNKGISCLRRHDFHFEKDIRILTIPEIVRFGARDLNTWRKFRVEKWNWLCQQGSVRIGNNGNISVKRGRESID